MSGRTNNLPARCALLVAELGGRRGAKSLAANRVSDHHKIRINMRLDEEGDAIKHHLAMIYYHVYLVSSDFNRLHADTGIVSVPQYTSISWKEANGDHRQAQVMQLKFVYRAGQAKTKPSTKIGHLIKHALVVNPKVRILYSPLANIEAGVEGMFVAKLDGTRERPHVYLSAKDLYSFELTPRTATHEFSHLNKFHRWLRWLAFGSQRFFVGAASIHASGVEPEHFLSSYLRRGFMSIDESRAFTVSSQVQRHEVKTLLDYGRKVSLAELRESFRIYRVMLGKQYAINHDLVTVLRAIDGEILNQGPSTYRLGRNGKSYYLDFYLEMGGGSVILTLPIKIGDDLDSAELKKSVRRKKPSPIAQIPAGVRAELLESLASQIRVSDRAVARVQSIAQVMSEFGSKTTAKRIREMIDAIDELD